jgi:hypothetical protein
MKGIVTLGLIGFFALTIAFTASHLSVGSMPSSKYISTPLYKPGDIIYIKPDSAKGVVVDVYKSNRIDSINYYKVNKVSIGGVKMRTIKEHEIYGR